MQICTAQADINVQQIMCNERAHFMGPVGKGELRELFHLLLSVPLGAVVAPSPAGNVGGFSVVGVLPLDRTNWSSESELDEVVERSEASDDVRRSTSGRRRAADRPEVLADLRRLVIVSPWGQTSPQNGNQGS